MKKSTITLALLFFVFIQLHAQIIFHSESLQGASGSSTTSPSVNRPLGVVQNDLILVIIHFNNRPTTQPSSSGFTQITSAVGNAGDPAAVYAFYKIAGSSEPASYTFTTTGSQNHRIQAIRVTGHNTSSPIGSTSSVRPGSAATSVTIPGVTTTNQSSVLVSAYTAPVDVVASGELKDFDVPEYMARLYRGNGSTSVPSYAAAREIINIPGSTGARTYSWASSERAAAIMFVVNPSANSVDTDGDGVQNYVDLDNDNDGITDANEGYSTVASSLNFSSLVSASYANGTYGTGNSRYTWSKGSNYTLNPYSNIFNAPPQVSTNGFQIGVVSSSGSASSYNINFNANVTNLKFSFSDWDGGNFSNGYEFIIVNVYDIGNNLLNAKDYVYWLGSNVQVSTSIANRFEGVEYNVNLTPTDSKGTLSFDFRSNVIDRIEISYGTLDASLRFQEPIFDVVTERNTDGDGLPDYLDLDSDNDGCHDAIEGGGSVTQSQLLTDGRIDILNQGGISSTGIPNITNTGQTIGSSLVATMLTISSPPSSFTVNTAGQPASFSIVTQASNNTSWSGTVNSRVPVYGTLGNANSQTIYQWYLGDPSSGGTALSNNSIYSGVTTSTLNISNTSGLMNNEYYVIVAQTNNPCIRQSFNSSLVPLPVKYTKLSATCTTNAVLVEWETNQEINNSHFEVLKKYNDDWIVKGIVKGEGNSNQILSYTYIDDEPRKEEVSYYKIKQVDFDANISFSNIVYANCSIGLFEGTKVYPNPFSNQLFIELSSVSNTMDCEIYNAEGKLIFKENLSGLNEIPTIDFKPGVYVIKLQNEINNKTYKIVKE